MKNKYQIGDIVEYKSPNPNFKNGDLVLVGKIESINNKFGGQVVIKKEAKTQRDMIVLIRNVIKKIK